MNEIVTERPHLFEPNIYISRYVSKWQEKYVLKSWLPL